jgi:hypothetical protein
MQIANETLPFAFPSWLHADDRSEVAGRVTARMKHAQALQAGHADKPASREEARV